MFVVRDSWNTTEATGFRRVSFPRGLRHIKAAAMWIKFSMHATDSVNLPEADDALLGSSCVGDTAVDTTSHAKFPSLMNCYRYQGSVGLSPDSNYRRCQNVLCTHVCLNTRFSDILKKAISLAAAGILSCSIWLPKWTNRKFTWNTVCERR